MDSVCEFIDPNPTPNTAICLQRRSLYDTNGNYIKSACLTDGVTHDNSLINCAKNGMELFIVNDAQTQTALFDWAVSMWGHGSGATFWVNGQRASSAASSSTGNWLVNNKGVNRPLFNGLTWDAVNTGNCLRGNNIGYDFSFDAFPCTGAMDSVCEFVLPNPTPNTDTCSETVDLFDSSNNYIKTLCVSAGLDHTNGLQNCAQNGMELFIINNAQTQTALFNWATSKWGVGTGATFWVNGQRDSSAASSSAGNWLVSDRGVDSPLFNGLTWDATNSGNCLRANNLGPNFSVDAFPCTGGMLTVCEYNK